jgi:glycosyltransferase involved in cell wall biosynthesis
MKILILSTGESDGAGRAACRLHQGLRQLGLDAQISIQHKRSNDPKILGPQTYVDKTIAKLNLSYRLDALPLNFYHRASRTPFSLQWLPGSAIDRAIALQPDIINLQWICQGYVPIEAMSKFQQPLVVTLHDMWAFTGGCHYNQTCDRYQDSCGSCPQLNSDRDFDLSRWVWHRKAKVWNDKRPTFVVLSQWMAKCAAASSLLKHHRIELIPNGIDIHKYKPIDRAFARQILNLPPDKQLILFGATLGTTDPRKGFHLLEPALIELSAAGWADRLEAVIFGPAPLDEKAEICGFKYHALGTITDEILLAIVYAAADVLVAPSVQDNLPNIVLEALACGTPCVAFNIGGLPDLLEHQKNGYLAKPFETEDLAQGIAWVLENPSRHQNLSNYAREKVEREFSIDLQAQRHGKLFDELMGE